MRIPQISAQRLHQWYPRWISQRRRIDDDVRKREERSEEGFVWVIERRPRRNEFESSVRAKERCRRKGRKDTLTKREIDEDPNSLQDDLRRLRSREQTRDELRQFDEGDQPASEGVRKEGSALFKKVIRRIWNSQLPLSLVSRFPDHDLHQIYHRSDDFLLLLPQLPCFRHIDNHHPSTNLRARVFAAAAAGWERWVGEEMKGDGSEEGREGLEMEERTSCSWDVEGEGEEEFEGCC